MVTLTQLLLLLLIGLARLDTLLGLLGLGDGLLDSNKPSVTLRGSLGLEGMLVARDLESKSDSAVLDEVGSIGLSYFRQNACLQR